ncbi:copine family protein 1-like [Mya arenaria]|uniref:copine family protein 1-like n=1 Tax=Mya arenaria TaxID=6604 RepID=UPI0022DF96EF|nr:copine family protein 1-like [Mya arenaria]XP_052761341.1 copine family protein 1-like [Mya arenaria]XP_052761342.1 copine family protein 1-like [Mya arenaria]XP_052761343.1 copine family protein 1-like [Mya arenaria]XP_052761344.1 copine family protein 1-like [Mya arenaria]XP_052761345.1 copine family protein 1-like [Mya arenaria]
MASRKFRAYADRFSTLTEVAEAIREEGLGKCGLIFGIDYTMSNKVQGEKTFHGKSLHEICEDRLNPYQEVIQILGQTLEYFDDDNYIPSYGFGDITTKDQGIFALKKGGDCKGFKEVLDAYNRITPSVKLHRPTNFAPLIYKAISIVQATKKYHILVIVADGQVTAEDETKHAIVAASHHPLSIIVIGVGDGPWGIMKEFDDRLPTRNFDNFQFVDFAEVMSSSSHPAAAFALACLMEIPDQYRAIRQLGYLEED